MLTPSHASGFTLIELLVGLALMGILLALGAPPMATYLQNSKVGSATTNYYTGVQMARAEAIRRNVQVDFVLTNTSVAAATDTVAGAITPSTAGPNWVVRAASGGTFNLIDSKAGAEGEGHAGGQSIVVASGGPGGFDGTIRFNGFGGTFTGGAYTVDVSNPGAGTCAALGGPIRCRRITVSPGGQIGACDPAAPASAGDTRAC